MLTDLALGIHTDVTSSVLPIKQHMLSRAYPGTHSRHYKMQMSALDGKTAPNHPVFQWTGCKQGVVKNDPHRANEGHCHLPTQLHGTTTSQEPQNSPLFKLVFDTPVPSITFSHFWDWALRNCTLQSARSSLQNSNQTTQWQDDVAVFTTISSDNTNSSN